MQQKTLTLSTDTGKLLRSKESKMIKIKSIIKEAVNDSRVEKKFNGKSGAEWRNLILTIPYKDLIEWSELSQLFKFNALLKAMQKSVKNL